jgi:hypothetical protein
MSEYEKRWMLSARCVEDECTLCGGTGVRLYGNTSTWRGGIGGAAMTRGQCDGCWGSGDKSRPWANMRVVEAQRRAWEAAQCAEWLARRTGVGLGIFRDCGRHVVELLRKEAARRKVPDDVEPFWYRRAVEVIAEALAELTEKDVKS